MTDDDERSRTARLVAEARDGWGRTLTIALTGVLAGISLGVVGRDAVAAPVVGSVPGVVPGVLGLLVAVGAYRRVGRCEGCGGSPLGVDGDCGCAADCGERRSRDA